jgi:hypothetical protein
MFCGLGHFWVGTFCSWDVLELGPFVLGRFVLGRFVLGRFVGAPYISCYLPDNKPVLSYLLLCLLPQMSTKLMLKRINFDCQLKNNKLTSF